MSSFTKRVWIVIAISFISFSLRITVEIMQPPGYDRTVMFYNERTNSIKDLLAAHYDEGTGVNWKDKRYYVSVMERVEDYSLKRILMRVFEVVNVDGPSQASDNFWNAPAHEIVFTRTNANYSGNGARGEWASEKSIYVFYEEWDSHKLNRYGYLKHTKILEYDFETMKVVWEQEAGANEVVLTIKDGVMYYYYWGGFYARRLNDWENSIVLAHVDFDELGLKNVGLDFKIENGQISYVDMSSQYNQESGQRVYMVAEYI